MASIFDGQSFRRSFVTLGGRLCAKLSTHSFEPQVKSLLLEHLGETMESVYLQNYFLWQQNGVHIG